MTNDEKLASQAVRTNKADPSIGKRQGSNRKGNGGYSN